MTKTELLEERRLIMHSEERLSKAQRARLKEIALELGEPVDVELTPEEQLEMNMIVAQVLAECRAKQQS